MSGHVYLGNDIDAPDGCISHHTAHIVLGVETAIEPAPILLAAVFLRDEQGGIVFCLGPVFTVDVDILTEFTPGSTLCEQRVSVYLQAPCHAVGQMPVEFVVLVERHVVEKLLGLLHRIEVSRGVEHQSAPVVGGLVLHLHHRHRPADALYRLPALYLVGQKLAQGADAVDHSPVGAGLDGDAAGAYCERVALVLGVGSRLQE